MDDPAFHSVSVANSYYAFTMDVAFSKWAAQYRKEMGQDLQYEDKYDFARAAFEGGYQAVKNPIPEATLRVECYSTNPPKPGCIHVVVDGKSVAILRLETVINTAKEVHDE